MNPRLLLLFLFLPVFLYASPQIDLGLSLGTLSPEDAKMQESFKRDFYMQGHLGVRDKASNLELRGNLGHYNSRSVHEEDEGTDTRLEITPLTASLLYHIGDSEASIQPYIGGGVGAYFYGIKDNTYGLIESGTRFGTHLMAGVKFYLDANLYIGAEYTRSFAGPVIFDKSDNFDQSMLTFAIGIQSSTEPQSKPSKASREKYESLLLTQINDLTVEIQKMKESKKDVETRINTFYENSLNNEYVNLFQVLDKPLVGQNLRITHPITQTLLAEGLIDSVSQSEDTLSLVLRNDKGWQLSVTVTKPKMALRIGNTAYNELNSTQVQKALQVERVRDDEAFAQELRRVQYLEGRLKKIDQSLTEAESQLASYHQQWKDTQPKTETIVHQVEERYRYYPEPVVHYHRPYPYRYYNPQDYVAPVYVPSTPPSAEERNQFIEAKKERIKSIRNR